MVKLPGIRPYRWPARPTSSPFSVIDNGTPPLTTSQSFAVVVGNSVALSIATSGNDTLTLKWSQGSLLQATNLLGPWVTNTAPSPYTVVPSNSQIFFKLRVD